MTPYETAVSHRQGLSPAYSKRYVSSVSQSTDQFLFLSNRSVKCSKSSLAWKVTSLEKKNVHDSHKKSFLIDSIVSSLIPLLFYPYTMKNEKKGEV
jgi:hypothetical protein